MIIIESIKGHEYLLTETDYTKRTKGLKEGITSDA